CAGDANANANIAAATTSAGDAIERSALFICDLLPAIPSRDALSKGNRGARTTLPTTTANRRLAAVVGGARPYPGRATRRPRRSFARTASRRVVRTRHNREREKPAPARSRRRPR